MGNGALFHLNSRQEQAVEAYQAGFVYQEPVETGALSGLTLSSFYEVRQGQIYLAEDPRFGLYVVQLRNRQIRAVFRLVPRARGTTPEAEGGPPPPEAIWDRERGLWGSREQIEEEWARRQQTARQAHAREVRHYHQLERRARTEIRRLERQLNDIEKNQVLTYVTRLDMLTSEELTEQERRHIENYLPTLARNTSGTGREVMSWFEVIYFGAEEAARRESDREFAVQMDRRHGSVSIDRNAIMQDRLRGLEAATSSTLGAVAGGVSAATGEQHDPENLNPVRETEAGSAVEGLLPTRRTAGAARRRSETGGRRPVGDRGTANRYGERPRRRRQPSARSARPTAGRTRRRRLAGGEPLDPGLERAWDQLVSLRVDMTDGYTIQKLHEMYSSGRRRGEGSSLVQMRANFGELRTLLRYAGNTHVHSVRFVRPGQSKGERTPDIEVIYRNGRSTFVEVRTFTQAPEGARVPRRAAPRRPIALDQQRLQELEAKIRREQISERRPGVIVIHGTFQNPDAGVALVEWRSILEGFLRNGRFPRGLRAIEISTGSGVLLRFQPPGWQGAIVHLGR